ncbi:hypothetical protein CFC21_082895 [Triticum aestivum]|uniref:TROVE domain-containing protein n=3 Tax=Triticum TaxID=4564 RepID=A0A9R1L5I2_WHEAT|nr:uncharacterized protein LOC123132490 [Triticum aestivum]KAF7078470.1 hypothetical protein CFC21_082895 [Triticum aestivum]
MVDYRLLGPPEARHAAMITVAAPTDEAFSYPKHCNVKKESGALGPAGKTRTKKRSPTFPSSGDPCLDFFRVLPATPAATVARLLAAAWAADPSTALRLVANLRGVRGSGKSDRESFYAAALWLHARHPATLARNAASVATFGYLKDLPELLHRIVRGGVSNKAERRTALLATGRRGPFGLGRCRDSLGRTRNFRKRRPRPKVDRAARVGTAEERLAAKLRHDRELSAAAAVSRRSKRVDTAATAIRRYFCDPTYRLLHDRTADLFASLLVEDMRKLANGDVRELSLAAKWCPSLGSSYDRSTLLCEAVARRLFPRGSSLELTDDLLDGHYAYRARERLRRTVLVPLRRTLQLPEVFMSARAWESVVYTRVASVAMKNYQAVFLKHDAERFNAYLADVKSGKKRIAAGALLPHQIIESLGEDGDGAGTGVADMQWRRMVDDMRALGKLANCVAVCDVSGSMSGLPMDVCVALGLLVSELTDDPWRGRVITFSERPEIHLITGDTLSEKVSFVRAMEWGMNTNFQAVFDKILDVAVAAGLPPERMVRRVLVFSDMEFDQASAHPWETDYEAIVRKFSEAGYGSAVPEIVFWNLAYSKAVPVMSGQQGVALVSGFSKNLLKLFLDGGGIVTPRTIMEKAIVGPEYDKLTVFD